MRTLPKRLIGAWFLALLMVTAPAHAGGRGHGYGHGYRDYHGGHWRHHGHYRHSRHHGHQGAYLLGGIVIGTVIGQALSAPRDYPRVESRSYRYDEPAVTRRLYRDIDGNCFERRYEGGGREVLVALPDYECDW